MDNTDCESRHSTISVKMQQNFLDLKKNRPLLFNENYECNYFLGLQTKDLSALGIRGILLKTRLLASSTYGIKVLNDDSKGILFFF